LGLYIIILGSFKQEIWTSEINKWNNKQLINFGMLSVTNFPSLFAVDMFIVRKSNLSEKSVGGTVAMQVEHGFKPRDKFVLLFSDQWICLHDFQECTIHA
jgi:hypothetical protein